jgi:uncharacterized membrane protein
VDRERALARAHWLLLGIIALALAVVAVAAVIWSRLGAPVILSLLPGLVVMTISSGILLALVRPRR